VTDPDKDDDDTQETIDVEIDADAESGPDPSGTFTIPETSDSSGRFEFYLAHDLADDVALSELDAINNNNGGVPVEYTGTDTAAPVIRFGSGEELAVTTGLFDDVSFDIQVGDTTVTVDYEESSAELSLDRDTYGSDSIVYLTITDQDANKNPTASDSFTVSESDLNLLVFEIEGATFNGSATFEETGDNTADFEATLQLTNAAAGPSDEIQFSDEAVEVTLHDKPNYDAPASINSTDTSSRSFDIDDEDGELDDISQLTFGSELKLTLRDNDQNKDSQDDETLDDAIIVTVDGAVGADEEFLNMEETDDNTGVFTIDLSNSELPITFLTDGASPTANNSRLELRQADITEDIVIEYIDPRDDDSLPGNVTSSFTVEMTLATGSIDVPDAAGINDDFIVTLTDADLNDNPRTKDSYTVVLTGTPEYDLRKGGLAIGALANIEIEVEGDPVDFGSTTITQTFVESDINSGVFTTEIDMQDILDFGGGGGALSVDDGDVLEVIYNDLMGTTSRESSDELAIGEASTGVDFSRTSLPIPPETGSATEAKLGGTVFVTLIVTDPDSNVASNAEDVLGFEIGDEPGQFFFEIEGDGFDAVIDEAGEESTVVLTSGVTLDEILEFDGLSLSETGKSTGVFDDTLEFVNGGMDSDEWHDMEITITFVDADGDEESAGITFRGNDGTVTVDQSSAKAGTILGITVEDQDLNLDDDEVEEFTASTDTSTPASERLLIVETEDEELGGEKTEQFRETGADTGIFTASYVVGTDIPISELPSGEDEVEQATNILITYNDEIDSTGGGGDEIEVNVPVASSTGAISTMPELVGPGTEVTVIITDTDLDQDSRSTDNYECEGSGCETNDDFFVSFRSDRTEVGRASPDIEETGPNTGVFEFTLELITDEGACEDDDLGADKFEAQGGSQPEIGACPGDLISVRYEDEQDGSGRSTTVSAIIEVKSWDPEFSSDKPSYNVGDRVTITISDPDANRKPDVADSLTDIRVFSDSDRVGEELSALETGRDTGVFRLSFGTSSGTAGGAVTVKTGDSVTIEYTDAFPADFEEEEDDKDFTFVVNIGAVGPGTGTTTPTEPAVRDPSGGAVSTIVPGQQVVLTTTVTNNIDEDVPAVILVEVRDSSGITQFLAWQTATIDADGRVEVGLSWTPDRSGDYQVRTFVISSLNNPQVLSEVKTTQITVS
jgi:hypothetical protein